MKKRSFDEAFVATKITGNGKGRTNGNGHWNGNGHAADNGQMFRTTVFLPDVLDQNLAVLSLRENRSKSDLLRDALSEFLTKNGLKPTRKPKVSVEY